MLVLRSAFILLLAASSLVFVNSQVDVPLDSEISEKSDLKTDKQQPASSEKLTALLNKLASPWMPYKGFSTSSAAVSSGISLDQFESTSLKSIGWITSQAKKSDGESPSYDGRWEIEQAITGTQAGDYALVLKDKSKHHAISRQFAKPLDFKGKKMFVVQYEVKLQQPLECGGAYMKLLSVQESEDSKAKPFDPLTFDNKQPFTIMFGPDKCGSTNKVHFIFRHKNKKTGEIVEHHLKKGPTPQTWENKASHLYRLIIYPQENRYEVSVDDSERVAGTLLGEEFEPSVEPPKEIEDPEDKKPETWDEREKIQDTNPENYNEDVPKQIPDENDVMPSDWNTEEQPEIEDMEATIPEDWDAEVDGEWVRPKVVNPKCKNNQCGKWNNRMKPNPEYKPRKMITNPNYKGVWKARKISNPEYESDLLTGTMTPIVGVGFELWTLQSDILFDNILISNSITKEELDSFTSATWKVKNADEKELAELMTPKPESTPGAHGKSVFSWKEQLSMKNLIAFSTLLFTSPRSTWDLFPALLGITAALTTLILLFLLSLVGSSKRKSTLTIKKPSSNKSASETEESEAELVDEKLLKDKTDTMTTSQGNLTRRNLKSKNASET